jgi:hypothetical protein
LATAEVVYIEADKNTCGTTAVHVSLFLAIGGGNNTRAEDVEDWIEGEEAPWKLMTCCGSRSITVHKPLSTFTVRNTTQQWYNSIIVFQFFYYG